MIKLVRSTFTFEISRIKGWPQCATSIGDALARGQINEFTRQLAHAMLGCAGGVATSGNSDGCAPGAVGAVVGELSARYAKDVLHWDDEKALAFAGVMSAASGVIVAQDGNDAGAVNLANTMGDNAARYNYLADHQEAKKAKELANCKTSKCKEDIENKWDKVSRDQDLAYGLGIGIGIGIGVLQAGVETLKALGSPIETVTALKDLLMQDDVLSTIGAATKQDFLNRIATMESEYQAGTLDGAKNAGIEVGRLILDVGSAVAGGAGAAKGVTTVVNKVATNVGKAAKVGGKGAAAGAITRTCSFRGDMQVKTSTGYAQIQNVKQGDWVFARDEATGDMTYKQVVAQYSNPYKETVYLTVKDEHGKEQTIVSNKIHPYFALPNANETLPPSSEGHNYTGKIKGAQWVDAANLKAGYKLLGDDKQWQEVTAVKITQEPLRAYNMTVADYHTYFIKGVDGDDGVWVHNNCDKRLPVPEKVTASNGLGYKSNSKHTEGGDGNRGNAGIEPPNSLELFEGSIPPANSSSRKRFSVDSKGGVHQFSNSNDGSWHWSGTINRSEYSSKLPNEVRKQLGVKP